MAAHGPFDIVVSANGLHPLYNSGDLIANLERHTTTNAIAIVSESAPAAYYDIIFGGTRGWFDTAVLDGIAHGRLRERQHWSRALAHAGFEQSTTAIATGDVGTSFIVGQRRAASPLDADAQSHDGSTPPRRFHLIAADPDAAGFVSDLDNHLAAAGATSTNAPAAALDDLFAAADVAADVAPDIVFVSSATSADRSHQDALLAQTAQLTALLGAIGDRRARLWIVAEGGARATAGLGAASPVQTGLWAYGRTALNECANLDIRLIDVGGTLTLADAGAAVAALIGEPGSLHEIILTERAVHGLQVRRGAPPHAVTQMPSAATATIADAPSPSQSPATADGPGTATVLELTQAGDLDGLTWTKRPRRAPAAGEVEIEVAATGLNFRDVMWSLGLLPEEALEDGFAGPTIGFECSGRILRVGADVTAFTPGDRVIAMAPACFASHVTVTTSAVARLPDTVPLADAASIPVAFLTAHYALDHLARLRQDEWVLIHGAAGGVGLAAVQIARRVGARIIATAGTAEKRAVLTALGADHVLDTRSLDFVDQVRALTGGHGVDVVLNSLAGEAMERSIDLTRPFGRFLELGKRDFYANTKVGLRPFRRNVSYFRIDADQLLTDRPDVVRTVFAEIMSGFTDATLTPLPHRVFAPGAVVDAFRLMQKSGHIGKILVTAPAADAGTLVTAREFKANPDGSHILVGGTGGFGLEMARWLADRGARHILVTSR